MSAGIDYRQIADRLWPVLRQSIKGHTVVYRATGGLIGHRFPGAPAVLLVDHVGAKSGTVRTTPLVYVKRRAKTSSSSRPRVATQSTPAGTTTCARTRTRPCRSACERRAVHARVASRDERARLWPKAIATYGGYRGYQQRTEPRDPARHPRAADAPVALSRGSRTACRAGWTRSLQSTCSSSTRKQEWSSPPAATRLRRLVHDLSLAVRKQAVAVARGLRGGNRAYASASSCVSSGELALWRAAVSSAQ